MLKTLQAATGLLVALFIAIHLLNTWLAALGPQIYDSVQGVLRSAYQWPPLEVLLLTALLVHIVTGLLRLWREPPRQQTARSRLHRYAGLFLALVIAGHILAVRGASWFFDVYPGFAGLAFSLEALPLYFYPYYFLLGLAGFYHGLNGTGVAVARLRSRVREHPGSHSWRLTSTSLYRASSLAAVLTVAALLALGGLWTDIGDPAHSDFAKLAKHAMELLGGSAP
ncbi:MAG: hypothetical protein AB8B93_05365 [Pseudomonadales bacterium]